MIDDQRDNRWRTFHFRWRDCSRRRTRTDRDKFDVSCNIDRTDCNGKLQPAPRAPLLVRRDEFLSSGTRKEKFCHGARRTSDGTLQARQDGKKKIKKTTGTNSIRRSLRDEWLESSLTLARRVSSGTLITANSLNSKVNAVPSEHFEPRRERGRSERDASRFFSKRCAQLA